MFGTFLKLGVCDIQAPKAGEEGIQLLWVCFRTYVWRSRVSLTSGDSLSWEGHNKPLLKEFSVTWEFKTLLRPV